MSRRLYPQRPIVGVGVMIKEGEEYLLIRRAAEPDKGLWSIPGGLVEVGERLREAAAREALEETGLTVEVMRELSVIDKIIRDEAGRVKYHFIIVDYLARRVSGELCASDDALEARWVSPDGLGLYELSPSFRDLLDRLGAEF